jgi:glycosyltransferase involved in cell wall biosynthesis
MKVLMLPSWLTENPYQNLLADNLRRNGLEVKFTDYPRTYFPLYTALKENPEINVIHLHWIAPYIDRALWSTKSHIQFLKLILFKIDFFLVKFNNVKIAWTIHNLYSHESSNKDFEQRIRKQFSKSADIIIFHSKRNFLEFEKNISKIDNKKVRIIHHGSYINQYPAPVDSIYKKIDNFSKKANLLFLGQIRKYKGLDNLMTVLISNSSIDINLIIAGKVIDKDLSERIIDTSKNDLRITYKPGFVKDEDLSQYFDWADAVLIPFEKTLTSGSAILGLSMGKVLILPESAEVIGLPQDAQIIFYSENGLSKCLEELPNKADLKRGGVKNLEVAKKLDWESVAYLTEKSYSQ